MASSVNKMFNDNLNEVIVEDYVIEHGIINNGSVSSGRYQLWKSGKLEQWGTLSVPANSNNGVALIKTFTGKTVEHRSCLLQSHYVGGQQTSTNCISIFQSFSNGNTLNIYNGFSANGAVMITNPTYSRTVSYYFIGEVV